MRRAADAVFDPTLDDFTKRMQATLLAATFRSVYPWLLTWAMAKERVRQVLEVRP